MIFWLTRYEIIQLRFYALIVDDFFPQITHLCCFVHLILAGGKNSARQLSLFRTLCGGNNPTYISCNKVWLQSCRSYINLWLQAACGGAALEANISVVVGAMSFTFLKLFQYIFNFSYAQRCLTLLSIVAQHCCLALLHSIVAQH